MKARERRPLEPFDCFYPIHTPPDDDAHYGVVTVVYKSVAIVAVGTTKHEDEPSFFEAREQYLLHEIGLRNPTRFLPRFVHAYWYRGDAREVLGKVKGRKQSSFKRATDEALVAHAEGRLIPTIPERGRIADLKNVVLADQFHVDLSELAKATKTAATSPTAGDKDGDAE